MLHMDGTGGASLSLTYLASERIIPGYECVVMLSVAVLHSSTLALSICLCT